MAWRDITKAAETTYISAFYGSQVEVVDTETGKATIGILREMESWGGRHSLVITDLNGKNERYLSYSARTGEPLTKYQVNVNQ